MVDPATHGGEIGTQQTSGSSSGASTSSETTTGVSSAANPDLEKHKERVIIIITKTVTTSIFPTVRRLRSDPSRLWATLKRKYEPSALQRILDLKSSLVEHKMTEGTSVEDYLKRVDRYVMDLGCVGEEIPDKELIQIDLRNLPDSWSSSSPFTVSFTRKTRMLLLQTLKNIFKPKK